MNDIRTQEGSAERNKQTGVPMLSFEWSHEEEE
jgi:hypothetical protein